jgi:hypothetical protein
VRESAMRYLFISTPRHFNGSEPTTEQRNAFMYLYYRPGMTRSDVDRDILQREPVLSQITYENMHRNYWLTTPLNTNGLQLSNTQRDIYAANSMFNSVCLLSFLLCITRLMSSGELPYLPNELIYIIISTTRL